VSDKPKANVGLIPYVVFGNTVTDVSGDTRNTKYVTEFYGLLDEVTRNYAGILYTLNSGDVPEAKRQYEKFRTFVEFRPITLRIQREIGKINTEVNAVWKDPAASPEAKKAAIDKLNDRRNQLAKVLMDEWDKR
jgi:hypothetical protein